MVGLSESDSLSCAIGLPWGHFSQTFLLMLGEDKKCSSWVGKVTVEQLFVLLGFDLEMNERFCLRTFPTMDDLFWRVNHVYRVLSQNYWRIQLLLWTQQVRLQYLSTRCGCVGDHLLHQYADRATNPINTRQINQYTQRDASRSRSLLYISRCDWLLFGSFHFAGLTLSCRYWGRLHLFW